MPIYAYRCESCGHAQDVLQKISDPLLTQCPACGAASFMKQVTAAGFQLKGTGWYVTDFRGGDSSSGKAATEGAKGSAPPASAPATDAGSCAPTSASASASSSSGGAADGGTQPGPSPSPSSSSGTS